MYVYIYIPGLITGGDPSLMLGTAPTPMKKVLGFRV
jgi:hypothetical protein